MSISRNTIKYLDEFIINYTNNYHIQIHFKRPIDGSQGSIEFDLTKDILIKTILEPYLNCKKFTCEDRKIHPVNVDRVSICRTEKSKKELLDKVIGPKSQKYDYLLENATHEFKIIKPKCEGLIEWIKIYFLVILIPISISLLTFILTALIIRLPSSEVIASTLGIAAILTALSVFFIRR